MLLLVLDTNYFSNRNFDWLQLSLFFLDPSLNPSPSFSFYKWIRIFVGFFYKWICICLYMFYASEEGPVWIESCRPSALLILYTRIRHCMLLVTMSETAALLPINEYGPRTLAVRLTIRSAIWSPLLSFCVLFLMSKRSLKPQTKCLLTDFSPLVQNYSDRSLKNS